MQAVIEKQTSEQTCSATSIPISEHTKNVRWNDLETPTKEFHHRRNLIDLCRKRDLSCHKNDIKQNVRVTISEERTQTSSSRDPDSSRNSPVISTGKDEEEKSFDEPLLKSSKIEADAAFISQKSNSYKSSKFFCQPSFKIGPKISDLPKITL